MIALFTDFGCRDPYLGQVKAVLLAQAPGVPVIDLLNEVPNYNPHAGAHLLAALAPCVAVGTVFFAVVDPGVGTPREGVVVESAGSWFIGPDNGLLSVLAARRGGARVWRIRWQPEQASLTFQGRDVFAPLAAELARGDFPAAKLEAKARLDVEFDAGDLPRVIYVDHYGNAWSGMRAAAWPRGTRLAAGATELAQAETFAAVGRGEAFWYLNSVGLAEVAVNRGDAAATLGLRVGDPVAVMRPN